MNKSYYATPRCPGTLKEGFESYNPSTLRGLFLGRSVFHVLPEPPLGIEWQKAQIKGPHFGGQQWYRMQLIKNQLVPDLNGGWLLKTVSPATSDVRFPMEQAGNEHLCLQLASQVFDIETIPNALIFFPDGQPALICRNIFCNNSKPVYLQGFEDFETLNARMNAASPKARTATYQQIAILIDHFVAASMIMKERFFSQLIFSFLIANASEHMKNFGLVKTSRNDLTMAPLFNMLCTRLHELGPELAAPGGLYEGDCDTPEFREYGHYTRNEFTAFGTRIGIAPARVEKILDQFVKENNQANELIDQAFLPMEAKNIIRYNFMERSYRLK